MRKTALALVPPPISRDTEVFATGEAARRVYMCRVRAGLSTYQAEFLCTADAAIDAMGRFPDAARISVMVI